MALTTPEQYELIGPLLRDVSRSFYLSLRVLPPMIRPQISIAYLLARASDTIADTKAVPREQRVGILRQIQRAVRKTAAIPVLDEIAERQTLPAEKALLEQIGYCILTLDACSTEDNKLIADLLQTIIGGQIFDLERFPGENDRELAALGDDELDRYTYMVAGCVGEFWTKMCVAHLPDLHGWDPRWMCTLGVRFGKGLQLINVLRDMPKDLRIGRCYLPVTDPKALLDPANFETVKPTYHRWLDTAVAHLDAGWEYTMAIPRRQARLRLACIWPIWIGLKTIARLRHDNPLDPTRRIQVSRGEVYWFMAQSVAMCRCDKSLQRRYQSLRRLAMPTGGSKS
ncbi:MAG: squalene/phytoene synthase family protein [Verrucomicrobiia bacterium]